MPREIAMSIYDNPDFFPPRDTVKAQPKYSAPVTNTLQDAPLKPTRKPRPTPSKNNDVALGFNKAALNKFKDTLGKIESANDYSVRGGFNDHYLGKYQLGKAALEDVGMATAKKKNKSF